jgi:hypothetical protein
VVIGGIDAPVVTGELDEHIPDLSDFETSPFSDFPSEAREVMCENGGLFRTYYIRATPPGPAFDCTGTSGHSVYLSKP